MLQILIFLIKSRFYLQDSQHPSGFFAAQSVKNTDSPHIHPGTLGFSSPSCPCAAAHLGARYGESLVAPDLGAGGHPVVLGISGAGRRSFGLLRGGDLAQPLEHTALGGGDAVGGGGGGGVRGR